MKKIIFCLVFVFAFGQGAFAQNGFGKILQDYFFPGQTGNYGQSVQQAQTMMTLPKCSEVVIPKFRYLYDDTPYAFIEDPDPVKNKANMDKIALDAINFSTQRLKEYHDFINKNVINHRIVTYADGGKADVAEVNIPPGTKKKMIDDPYYASDEYKRYASMSSYTQKKQAYEGACY